jgi:hypothetical protein
MCLSNHLPQRLIIFSCLNKILLRTDGPFHLNTDFVVYKKIYGSAAGICRPDTNMCWFKKKIQTCALLKSEQ